MQMRGHPGLDGFGGGACKPIEPRYFARRGKP